MFMIYRLVYTDDDGNLYVQYGKNAVSHLPSFLPESQTKIYKNITTHNTLNSAITGRSRYEALHGKGCVEIQYAKSKNDVWAFVVSDNQVRNTIEELVYC